MQRTGLLTATARLVAQGETIAAATAAGTPTALGLQRFGHFHGSIKREGSLLGEITTAQVTYSNNLDRVETIRPDGKIEGLDAGMAMLSGNIVGRFASTTLLDQAVAGTPCELEFAWTISASLSLVLTAHAVYLPVPRLPIDGPRGREVTFDWQGAKDTSPARMFTAVLTNSVADY
jgi:hypothetical protein